MRLPQGVVLFLQLHANVQLLARADVWLETAVPALAGRRAVAFLTFALWSLALARGCKGCPAAPKAAAVGAVLAAYAAGPMLPPVVQMERFCALAFAALLGSRAVLAVPGTCWRYADALHGRGGTPGHRGEGSPNGGLDCTGRCESP